MLSFQLFSRVFKHILVLCFLILSLHISAQEVDLVMGTAHVSIPLYTLQERDLKIPLELNYLANGVKVADEDGWIGHNWSLSVQAQVSREVRGLPDDYLGSGGDTRKGWLHGDMGMRIKNFNPQGDLNLAVCTDEVADYNFLSTFGFYEDTEPDLFTVSALGLNFSFYFDENKSVQVQPYQDVTVTYQRGAV